MPEPAIKTSEQINELIAAVATARKHFKAVVKTSSNPFYKSKYADLNELVTATVDALSDAGLHVFQFPVDGPPGTVGITTRIAHKSGQFIESSYSAPLTKADVQGMGSAITYARRYAYGALLNLAAEDDDGNAAVSTTTSTAVAGNGFDLNEHLEHIANANREEIGRFYSAAFNAAPQQHKRTIVEAAKKRKEELGL